MGIPLTKQPVLNIDIKQVKHTKHKVSATACCFGKSYVKTTQKTTTTSDSSNFTFVEEEIKDFRDLQEMSRGS